MRLCVNLGVWDSCKELLPASHRHRHLAPSDRCKLHLWLRKEEELLDEDEDEVELGQPW